jgi:transposase
VRETTRERDKDIRAAVKLGLSLRVVAEAAGVGHSTVRRIVNGR